MKNYIIIFTFAIWLMLVQGKAWAGPNEGPGHKGSMMEHISEVESKASDLIVLGNKICPVSGKSVDVMGKPYQVEYNGKLYNLCCKMCAKSFKKDSAKYSKIAEEEVETREEGKSEEHKGSHME